MLTYNAKTQAYPAPILPSLPNGLLREKGDAREIILKYGLPQHRSPCAEAWKYTSIKSLAKYSVTLPQKISTTDAKIVEQQLLESTPYINNFPDALRLLFIDGHLHTKKDITPYAGTPHVDEKQPMAALNIASRCEAWKITLDEKNPFLHIISVESSEKTPKKKQNHSMNLSQKRLRIEVAENSHATILQTSLNASEYCWANDFFEINVAQGANCEHVVLHSSAPNSHNFTRGVVNIAENGHYKHVSALRGKGLTRQEVSVNLNAENAACALHGAYRPEGTGHIDNSTEIVHAKPNCSSDALFKGVIEDRACGIFHGKIHVAKEAQKTKGFQMSRALLLSNHARAYHKPELEIYADDVKCSHGATIGELNEEQIFYLRARGLTQKRAQDLLLEAFLNEALTCKHNECQKTLRAHIL